MKTGTFLASEMRILWRILDSHQIDPRSVCREVGLDPAVADAARARYPFERVVAAWRRAAERCRDPGIGLQVAQFYRATDFHGLAVVFLASNNLRAALARLVRYHVVVNTARIMRAEEREGRLELSCHVPPGLPEDDRVLQDARAAIILDLCRTGASDIINPVETAFTYRKPDDCSTYETIFRCTPAFGAPHWKMSFRLEDAQRPFLASNKELARNNDHVLEAVAAHLREQTLLARVKMAMMDELPSGTPSEESIARSVSLSGRSLQRRLASEGTTFKELLGMVRRELAERYVAESDMPITEITYVLGFSDVSSFSRAFKRWTGSAPATTRTRMRSSAAVRCAAT